MAKHFFKVDFEAVARNYRVVGPSQDPLDVMHPCSLLRWIADEYGSINTCAVRMSEALVLAAGLARSRAEIARLQTQNHGAAAGKDLLLGLYGYQDNLCPHGIARGAAPFAEHFLTSQWGPPERFRAPGTPPAALRGRMGVLSFLGIPGYTSSVGTGGHLDLWYRDQVVGHGYFDAREVLFWELPSNGGVVDLHREAPRDAPAANDSDALLLHEAMAEADAEDRGGSSGSD